MIVDVENLDAVRDGKCLVDFYTPTCIPCKTMHPILEEVSEEFPDVKFVRVDVTKHPLVSQAFGITTVPTCMFLHSGKVVSTLRGMQPKPVLKSHVMKSLSGKAVAK